MSREAFPGAASGEGQPAARQATPAARSRAGAGRAKRPSLGGGRPAQDRELRAQGRQTVRRLLEAGLAEFDERGFQAVRVDDIVRRARTSHGTFYLYFSNKDDFFKALLRDALHDMGVITDAFPVVTRNDAGRAALRQWVHSFCETYAAHAAVVRDPQPGRCGRRGLGRRAAAAVPAGRGDHPGMTAASPNWQARARAGDAPTGGPAGRRAAAGRAAGGAGGHGAGQPSGDPAATASRARPPGMPVSPPWRA
jgi:AcrR family transcriptional regulator